MMNSLYEQIGGADTIQKLVEAFYPKVFSDEDLKPLFQGQMEEIMYKQKTFLTQFLGGPMLYSEEFGPPAMQQRHLPFEITPTRARAWLRCMKEAFEEVGLFTIPAGHIIYERLTQVAGFMINTMEDKPLEN